MEKLFEPTIDVKTDFKARTESSYEYLNRSSRPEIRAIRTELEKWFLEFPSEAKADLRGRFRSHDDRDHAGAFFELYCFRFLERHGYSVKPHVSVDTGMSTKPDFLVHKGDIPLFYMECTVYGQSNESYAGEARLAVFYEAINKIESPNFFLGVSIKNNPTLPVSSKKVKRELEQWLSTLDPDVVMNDCDVDNPRPPSIEFCIDGWTIEFMALPKRAEARGQPGLSTLGMEFSGAHWVNCRGPLSGALRAKASKYGEMELPYIIAVNAILDSARYPDNDDIVQVLFGEIKYRMNLKNDSTTPFRESNGFWLKKWSTYPHSS